jgi:hypothetical protein
LIAWLRGRVLEHHPMHHAADQGVTKVVYSYIKD